MAGRAIWKGDLVIGRSHVPVKVYGAVEDRKVHFTLLHAKDQAPVAQRIVRKDDDSEVPRDERRKALPLDKDRAVILQPDELAALEPEASREVHLCRFVSPALLNDQWFDRPYWLGPDDDEGAYFALARALTERGVIGIARWVMRKKRYLAALGPTGDYLTLITLRRAEQVLALPALQPDKSRTPSDQEIALAQQLLASIAGDFEPEQWPDEYRERLCKLIEAKAKGRKLRLVHSAPPKPTRDLAESLRASLNAARERKHG